MSYAEGEAYCAKFDSGLVEVTSTKEYNEIVLLLGLVDIFQC